MILHGFNILITKFTTVTDPGRPSCNFRHRQSLSLCSVVSNIITRHELAAVTQSRLPVRTLAQACSAALLWKAAMQPFP